MSNLKCHEKCCANNCGCHCEKESINISKTATCLSYEPGDERNINQKFEFSSEPFSLKTDEHEIFCEDDSCQNNEYHQCLLCNLRIDECSRGPVCVNYRSR